MLIWIGLICLGFSVSVILIVFMNSIRTMNSPAFNAIDIKGEDTHQGFKAPSRFNKCISRGGLLIQPFMTWNHRARLTKALLQAGKSYIEHQDFYFIQILMCVAMMSITITGYMITENLNRLSIAWMSIFIVAGSSGYFLPTYWLKRITRTRNQHILKALPFFLDMLSLGLNAGMSLQSALQLTLKHLDDGPLKSEWGRFLFDVRSGFTRSHALKELSGRVDVSALRQFVAALIQGESMGLSLTKTVREYAKQLCTARLLHAEKLAFQAPVKMLFPLAICIFPCTFLVLGFPVLAKILELK